MRLLQRGLSHPVFALVRRATRALQHAPDLPDVFSFIVADSYERFENLGELVDPSGLPTVVARR